MKWKREWAKERKGGTENPVGTKWDGKEGLGKAVKHGKAGKMGRTGESEPRGEGWIAREVRKVEGGGIGQYEKEKFESCG